MQTLADILLIYGGLGQTIVFTSTKAEANQLLVSDKMKADIEVMHGDIAQNQREVTLKRFKEQKFSVLVATDVAARGIDIPAVALVVNYDIPNQDMVYFHRIGRTARAGAKVYPIGQAIEKTAIDAGFNTIRDLRSHGIGRSLHEEPHFIHNFSVKYLIAVSPNNPWY